MAFHKIHNNVTLTLLILEICQILFSFIKKLSNNFNLLAFTLWNGQLVYHEERWQCVINEKRVLVFTIAMCN